MAKKRAHGEGTLTKRKDDRWEGRLTDGYTEKGPPKRRTVHGRTQAEARRKLALSKQQVASDALSDTAPTVATYLEHYLVEKARDVKPSTLEQYETCVRRCIVPSIGESSGVTPIQVQTLLGKIRDASGAARAAKCRTLLLSAYKRAVRLQLVTRNPVEAVDPIRKSRASWRYGKAEAAGRFLDAARKHRLYAPFYLALAAELRWGELPGLRWRDVEGDVIHVRQSYVKVRGKLVLSTPKNRNAFRSVAVSSNVLEILFHHRQI